MQKYFLAYFIFFTCGLCSAADSKTSNLYIPRSISVFHPLGNRIVEIKVQQYGETSDLVFINVHDDEVTSVAAAKGLLETNGGLFIKLENGHKRNIKFRLDGQFYTFDPNQIFSRNGIIKSLGVFGRTGNKAVDEIEKLANRILQLIPQNPSCIIALHNNTDGNFSAFSYTAGKEREKDSKAYYINPEEDPDDVFFTTDSLLFTSLAAKRYNTILQDNEMIEKDGSLSVYFGERNICYLNCETQHGKLKKYEEMIFAAFASITSKLAASASALYSVRIHAPVPELFTQTGNDLLFAGRKIGTLKPGNMTAFTGSISGKLEIDKSFPLYSNMRIVLVDAGEDGYRLEIEEDATAEKQLVEPGAAVIQVRMKG